jgi:hypothetical protein
MVLVLVVVVVVVTGGGTIPGFWNSHSTEMKSRRGVGRFESRIYIKRM